MTRTLGEVYLEACNSDSGFLEVFEKFLEQEKRAEYLRGQADGYNAGAVSVLATAATVELAVHSAASKSQGL